MATIPYIEEKYVRSNYDTIAVKQSAIKFDVWEKVKQYILSLPSDSLVAEIGFGTGKNMIIRKDIKFKGCDNSEEIVKRGILNNLDVVSGDVCAIPFTDNQFDHTMCVAVIHHLSTNSRRRKALEELVRITKPGGSILIEVFSNQYINKGEHKDKVVYECDDDQNAYLKLGNNKLYYYGFKKGELEDIIVTLNNVTIIESFNECEEWGIILQKSK